MQTRIAGQTKRRIVYRGPRKEMNSMNVSRLWTIRTGPSTTRGSMDGGIWQASGTRTTRELRRAVLTKNNKTVKLFSGKGTLNSMFNAFC